MLSHCPHGINVEHSSCYLPSKNHTKPHCANHVNTVVRPWNHYLLFVHTLNCYKRKKKISFGLSI